MSLKKLQHIVSTPVFKSSSLLIDNLPTTFIPEAEYINVVGDAMINGSQEMKKEKQVIYICSDPFSIMTHLQTGWPIYK